MKNLHLTNLKLPNLQLSQQETTTTACPAAESALLKYRGTVTHETENGYIKVTEANPSSMFGPMLTVATSDTLVMDVALRVEENLKQVTVYSRPDGSNSKALFYIEDEWIRLGENKIIQLFTDKWTKVRMVWDLDSSQNNLIMYEYDGEKYVQKGEAVTLAVTGLPPEIRFQSSTPSDTTACSLHLDDFTVYTTSDTEYVSETLTQVKAIYGQNYDASCDHTTTACPAAESTSLKYRGTVTHATE